jgi:hypothetical protein
MTRHRLTNIALSLGLAVAFAAVLSLGPALDDHTDEWAQSTALRDAQQHAQAEARRERAEQQLCIKIAGPGVAPTRDADGRLVCTARRGPARTVVAGGAL